mgnify:FL=1
MIASFLSILHYGVFGFLLSLILAAAVHKLNAPANFQRSLQSYDFLPSKLASSFAKFVPWLEITVIAAAIVCYAMRQIELSFLLLFTLFTSYSAMISTLVFQKRTLVDCGCSLFDSNVLIAPKTLLMRNIALIILCCVFYLTTQQTTGSPSEWLFGLTFSCFLFVIYSSVDLLLENHVLLSKLRLKHD